MCFPVNFAKFLRTFFLQNTGRLLLNILAIMQHMFSLQNLLYNWLVVWNKTVDMLLKPVKLLKKEQFVPLYYRLPPVEGVTIDTQVVLHWMDYPPKTSSPNSTWAWDFHGVLLPFDDSNQLSFTKFHCLQYLWFCVLLLQLLILLVGILQH